MASLLERPLTLNDGPEKEHIDFNEFQLLGPGPEANESARAAKDCTKNPGHKSFIPVSEFAIKHLPERFQGGPELLEYIKAMADLTVRLRICEASSERPDRGYYGLDNEGMRTGTGFIKYIVRNNKPCHCSVCEAKPEGEKRSWRLGIQTAQHVVFDGKEARWTKVDLFYDSEECRKDGRMKTVEGGKVLETDETFDWCVVWFTTCDSELGAKLELQRNRRYELQERLVRLYGYGLPFVCIVSHPHGIAKHLTIGEVIQEQQLESGYVKYSYDADTCPGSSGARVLGFVKCKLARFAPHHCKSEGENGWNVGFDW